MKFTGYITKFYPLAEESLEIIIDNVDDIEDFKSRIFQVLQVCDYRGNLQARRLFEDTDLVNELNSRELRILKTAVEILFPFTPIPHSLELNSSSWDEEERKGKGGIQFTKSLRDGEVLKIYLHNLEPEEDSQEAIKSIYKIIDSRLEFTNKRETKFATYLRKLDMNDQLKITMILGILYKQTDVPTVIERLKGQKLNETVQEMRNELQGEQNNAS